MTATCIGNFDTYYSIQNWQIKYLKHEKNILQTMLPDKVNNLSILYEIKEVS